MVDPRIYTAAEYRKIHDGAKAYDEASLKQLEGQQPKPEPDAIEEIYREITEDNMDAISFLAQDIGVLNRVRATWRDNEGIQEYAKYLIMVENEKMNELMEEIAHGYGRD